MLGDQVLRWNPSGSLETVTTAIKGPSGIGFDATGHALVVSREDILFRIDDSNAATELYDLGAYGSIRANDLVCDDSGQAYFGSTGTRYGGGNEPSKGDEAPGSIFLIEDVNAPDGAVRMVAERFTIPNGMVITPDRKTLVVAETIEQRLWAFDRSLDGSLSNRRLIATFERGEPDGMALDENGGIWVGMPKAEAFVRVSMDGVVLDHVDTPGWWAVACALGGPDRSVLYMAVCQTSMEELRVGKAKGRVLAMDVEVPGAGWP
jgi:sugar lactone lactonase YvrE